MTLLPTGWIKMPGDNDETKRFAWSHVKSIFYNKAANVLLKDKLDEMDKIIDEKIAKALMSNVQVNDQSKIPTSALAYAMQQSITKNGQDIAKLNNNLALQTQTLYKNVVIYRIGNIAMLSAPSWVRKEELAGVTIPTGYRPVKTISIPFTQQNFNDGAYCDVSTEGKIDYTGTSPIVINAIWFCT